MKYDCCVTPLNRSSFSVTFSFTRSKKMPKPRAQHRPGRRTSLGVDAPRQRHARREIPVVADVVLRFVPQPVAEGQVGTRPPIVVQEQSGVELAHRRQRRARAQTELRSAAAQQADLRVAHPRLLEYQRAPVALERRELRRTCRPAADCSRPAPDPSRRGNCTCRRNYSRWSNPGSPAASGRPT